MTVKKADELFGDDGPNGPRSPIDLSAAPGMGVKNRAVKYGEAVTSFVANRIAYALAMNDDDLEHRLHVFETGGIDATYRLGALDQPGGGRIIRIDGGAVEARSIHDAQYDADPSNACFRANLEADTVNGGSGFETVARNGGAADTAPGTAAYGFLDRRSLILNTASTRIVSTQSGRLNVGNADKDSLDVVAPGFFGAGGATELFVGTDFVQILDGAYAGVYLIQALTTDMRLTLLRFDGAEPSFAPDTVVTFRLYRPVFGTAGGAIGGCPIHGARFVAPPGLNGPEPALVLMQANGSALVLRACTPTADVFTVNAAGDVVAARHHTCGGNLSVGGNAGVAGGLTVGGSASVGTTLHVAGDFDAEDAALRGGATIAGALSVAGNVDVGGALQVTGNIQGRSLTLSDTLHVQGSSQLDGPVVASSTAAIGGALTVAGTAAVAQDVTLAQKLAVTGNLTVGGTAAVAGTLAVAGTAVSTFAGPLTAKAPLTITGTAVSTVGGPLTVSGAATFGKGIDVAENSVFAKDLSIVGGLFPSRVTTTTLTATGQVIADSVDVTNDVLCRSIQIRNLGEQVSVIGLPERSGWFRSSTTGGLVCQGITGTAVSAPASSFRPYEIDLKPYRYPCGGRYVNSINKIEVLVRQCLPGAGFQIQAQYWAHYWDAENGRYFWAIRNPEVTNINLADAQPLTLGKVDFLEQEGVMLVISGVQPGGIPLAEILAVRLFMF